MTVRWPSSPQDEVTHVIRPPPRIAAQAIQASLSRPTLPGPATDNGFYCDVDLPEGVKISEDDFPPIEAEMKKIVRRTSEFSCTRKPRAGAIALWEERGEEIQGRAHRRLDDDARITFHQQGDYIDMCVGPHLLHQGAEGL